MNLYELSCPRLDGTPQPLSAYRGKVALVVNVASECGYTPQYAGLEELWRAYQERGLVVLGFPCNQFGAQEPGDAAQIQAFCQRNYGVSFPLFEKVDVKGDRRSPVYAFLAEGREGPQWNFHKYLVGREGQVLGSYSSGVAPASPELVEALEAALA